MMHRKAILCAIFAALCGTIFVTQAQKLNRSSRQAPEQTIECRESLSNCTDMVTPYLMNQNYMFPQNIEHVNDMCRMWSGFVDCTRRYISACFEEKRRALFHKSVEGSIDTVHAICSSKTYQTEYLGKAQCFKRVSVEHCAENYQDLVATVANPYSHDDHICCHYANFRKCVNTPLLTECGRKSKNLMDHSMSFLISRCQLYNKAHENCPKPKAHAQPRVIDADKDPYHRGSKSAKDSSKKEPTKVVSEDDGDKLLTATTTDAVTSEAPKIGMSAENSNRNGKNNNQDTPNSKVIVGRAFNSDDIGADEQPGQFNKQSGVSGELESVDNQLNGNSNDDFILEKKIDMDAQPESSSTEETIVYTIKPQQFQAGAFHMTSTSISTLPSLTTSLISSIFTLFLLSFTFL